MILLDTHTWLWLRSAPRLLSTRARTAIANDTLAVSAISCWEIATLSRLGRVELDRGVAEWISRAVAERPPVTVLGVSREVAVSAGELPSAFPGGPADRIIFATAAAQRCALVTKDRRLRSYSPASTVW